MLFHGTIVDKSWYVITLPAWVGVGSCLIKILNYKNELIIGCAFKSRFVKIRFLVCECNEVFMINFKILFLQNRSIYSIFLFVSKTYVLPLTGTSTSEKVILLLRGSLAVAFNKICCLS